jgi:putative Holliday junction resolvase
MRAAGRDARSSRASIDAAAAVVLLQSALDGERNTGEPAGELLEVRRD